MFTTAKDYLTLPRAPETWILEPILPVGGLLNVYGKPKGGKTFLALQMAVGVSDPGTSQVLGWPVRTHGSVCFLQLDTPRSMFTARYVERADAAGWNTANLWIADAMMLPSYPMNILGTGSVWLRNALQAVQPSPVMLVIDTMRDLYTGDENDSGIMRNVLTTLIASTHVFQPPPAIVILSHQRKLGPDTAEDLLSDNRGSSYVSGRMDCVMKVTGNGKKGQIIYQSRAIDQQVIKVKRTEQWFWELEVEVDLAAEVARHPNWSFRQCADWLHETFGESPGTWRRRITEAVRGGAIAGRDAMDELDQAK